MTICEKCQDKTCLKTKKPCQAVEGILKGNGIKSSEWIRPMVSNEARRKLGKGRWREIPFSALSSIDKDKNPYLRPDNDETDPNI